jgi:DhnA family fructose-bisphosphate aldolase class Ia
MKTLLCILLIKGGKNNNQCTKYQTLLEESIGAGGLGFAFGKKKIRN